MATQQITGQRDVTLEHGIGNRRMLGDHVTQQPCVVRYVVRAGRDHFQTHSDLRAADHSWYLQLQELINDPETP